MVAYSCVRVSDERAGTGSVKTSERLDAAAAARGVDVLDGELHSREQLPARPGDPVRGQRADPAEHIGTAPAHPV
jgi:hypothetical protein